MLNPARLLVGSEELWPFPLRFTLNFNRFQPTKRSVSVIFPAFMKRWIDPASGYPQPGRGGTRGPDDDRTGKVDPPVAEKLKKFVMGEPDSLLLVEFTGEELKPLQAKPPN